MNTLDNAYKKDHPKPIPIGKQEYGYQCEDVFFDFTKMHGKVIIDGYAPSRGGKYPYPNEEKEEVEKYELELRHRYNGIEICLQKVYRDGRIGIYITTVSFADFANRLFEGHPASSWIREPMKQIIKDFKK